MGVHSLKWGLGPSHFSSLLPEAWLSAGPEHLSSSSVALGSISSLPDVEELMPPHPKALRRPKEMWLRVKSLVHCPDTHLSGGERLLCAHTCRERPGLKMCPTNFQCDPGQDLPTSSDLSSSLSVVGGGPTGIPSPDCLGFPWVDLMGPEEPRAEKTLKMGGPSLPDTGSWACAWL